jgi:protein gp37
MSEITGIEWTDHTLNWWIGCTEVSPGCDECYAKKLAERYGWAKWGKGEPRYLTSEENRRQPFKWNRQAEVEGRRHRVFCASLADDFDSEIPQTWRDELFDTIRATPWLDWQLLTKRPHNIKSMLPPDWGCGWPNVWLGTTVENNDYRWRIDELLKVEATIHFLSCEPLLGPIDLGPWLDCLDWVIVGGESGRKVRLMHPDWARQLRNQCQQADVAFFFKQAGRVMAKEWGCKDDKGGDPSEWPAEFRVRQFPRDSRIGS